MPILYYVNVTIHILAAMLWLGGMFFLGLAGAPALRAIEEPVVRQRLFQDLGMRFRAIGWWCIGILVVTGIFNLHYRGWLHWDGVLGSSAFWGTAVGKSLGIKLLAVTAMIVVSAVHDFWLGPLAGKQVPGSPEALGLRRRAGKLARINALLGLVVVIVAVQLARGV
ncbi:MAG TPA: CopD family protein [Gemmatimonadaceae bacterium]|nr:CopD family protein [Gemmatimonadaceae bacterium]